MMRVIVFLASCVSLIIAIVVSRYLVSVRRQMKNVMAARNLGCWVIYNFEIDRSAEEWLVHCGDAWWRKWLGSDAFGRIVHISMMPHFESGQIDGSDRIAFLASSFRDLRGLLLAGRGFGDDALSHIAEMKSLERLWLVDTDVSDRGLRCLTALGQLREVSISESNIREDTVAEVRRMLPNCKIQLTSGENNGVRGRWHELEEGSE